LKRENLQLKLRQAQEAKRMGAGLGAAEREVNNAIEGVQCKI